MAIRSDKIPGLSKNALILQVSFWISFIIYEIVLAELLVGKDSFYNYLQHYLLYIGLFYFHTYGLLLKTVHFPHIRWGALLLGLLGEMVIFYLLNCFLYLLSHLDTFGELDIYFQVNSIAKVAYRFLYMAGMSTTYWLGLSAMQQQRNIHEMEKQKLQDQLLKKDLVTAKLQTELAFLKAQIQPHFLLNALQKIYIQTQHQPLLAGTSVMQLAALVQHHLISDSRNEDFLLSEELHYIKHYIQMQRLVQTAHLELRLLPEEMVTAEHIPFPPLLISTIIENVFSHGALHQREQPALIHFDISSEQVKLQISNQVQQGRRGRGRGIGMSNVRERLQRLYPGRHHLDIDEGEEIYRLYLQIQIRRDL